MKKVKYILVNEKSTANRDGVFLARHLRDIRHFHIVDGDICHPEERAELVKQLASLRQRYPNARILGVSEVDGKYIRPSEAMNAIRRELSDLA